MIEKVEQRRAIKRQVRAALLAEEQQQSPPPQVLEVPDETEPWTPPANAHPEIRLLDFVRGAWRILEPAVPFVDGWHINLLCEHLEALSTNRLAERDLLINEPPGSSKSLITAVFWPAWEWTWAPWTRWLTTSYDEGLALRDAVRTRTLMQSVWYQRLINEPWEFSSDQNVKGYYTNDRTGWRIARGIHGQITAHHAHRVLVDDPHNVTKSESDTVREGTITILRETFPSRVLPGGCTVIIGQRVHEEDASAEWMERKKGRVHHIEIQEEFEPDETRKTPDCTLRGGKHDIRTYEGELLTPERYPNEVIEQRKIDLGPYAYSAQFQQRPTPRAGMVLNPAWFVQTPDGLQRNAVDIIMTFDLNFSEKDSSDWTVGMVGAVERTAVLPRMHIVDVMRDHLPEEKHVTTLGEWILLWQPLMVGIEKRAFEKQGATKDLCRQLMIFLEQRGFTTTIEPVEADTDKVSRAQIIPGRAARGLITVDRHASWWPKLSREMSMFPKSEHDDQVDTLAYLVRMAVEKLAKVRGQRALLGHSAPMSMTEAPPPSQDWQLATASGLR